MSGYPYYVPASAPPDPQSSGPFQFPAFFGQAPFFPDPMLYQYPWHGNNQMPPQPLYQQQPNPQSPFFALQQLQQQQQQFPCTSAAGPSPMSPVQNQPNPWRAQHQPQNWAPNINQSFNAQVLNATTSSLPATPITNGTSAAPPMPLQNNARSNATPIDPRGSRAPAKKISKPNTPTTPKIPENALNKTVVLLQQKDAFTKNWTVHTCEKYFRNWFQSTFQIPANEILSAQIHLTDSHLLAFCSLDVATVDRLLDAFSDGKLRGNVMLKSSADFLVEMATLYRQQQTNGIGPVANIEDAFAMFSDIRNQKEPPKQQKQPMSAPPYHNQNGYYSPIGQA